MDVVINTMVYFWCVVAIFFLVMEMGSPGLFFFVAFFFGGISAALGSFFVESVIMQTVFFFCGTGGALLVLQRYIVPLLGKDRPHERTNIYALQGKRGFVLQTISAKIPGMIRLNGEMWVARSINGETIEKGDQVEVVDMRGAHVIVKKFQ